MKSQVCPSVNVFVIDGSKVLLGRRVNTGWMDGFLCPFGGHVEAHESPTAAILREIQEELGVKVKASDLEFVCVAARNTAPTEYAAYEFAIKNKNYHFVNAEPEKCSELVWADMHNLPDDMVEDFRQVINQGILDSQLFLEIGY
jgi:8-oxo-dGTP diphosphatase